MADAEPINEENATMAQEASSEKEGTETALKSQASTDKSAAKKSKKEVTKKGPTTKKAKKATNHPKYSEMIRDALTAIKERGGSSRQAILKYIMGKYNTGHDEKIVNLHLKMALRAGVKNGTLLQSKGSGASGSFKLGDKTTSKSVNTKKDKPKKKAKAKKTTEKKDKPKKVTEKKSKKNVKKSKATKKTKVGSSKKAVKGKKAKS